MKLHINIDLNELTTIIENHIKKELNITLQDGELEIDSSKGITIIGSTDKNTKVETKEKKEPKEDKEEESVSSILGSSEDEDTESETEESKVTEGQANQSEIASLFN